MGRLASVVVAPMLLHLVAAIDLNSALADEARFTRLAAKDIRAKVIGKVVTDGAHWSDYFDKDGALISFSQGRKSTGTWQIRGGELCISEEAGAAPTCYEVWIAGEEISLRVDGVESTFSGYLRSP